MCKLDRYLQEEKVCVYKIAWRENGNYYSPATGVRYLRGKMPIPEVQRSYIWIYDQRILDPKGAAFVPEMVGRTAGFKFMADAIYELKSLAEGPKAKKCLTLLKMTLSDSLMEGTYGSSLIIAGKNIVSYKKIGNYETLKDA